MYCFYRWDPSSRITPDEALQHEWLQLGSSSTSSGHTENSSTTSGSQEPVQTTSERRSAANVGGANRKTGPINQNSIEDENISIYKVRNMLQRYCKLSIHFFRNTISALKLVVISELTQSFLTIRRSLKTILLATQNYINILM